MPSRKNLLGREKEQENGIVTEKGRDKEINRDNENFNMKENSKDNDNSKDRGNYCGSENWGKEISVQTMPILSEHHPPMKVEIRCQFLWNASNIIQGIRQETLKMNDIIQLDRWTAIIMEVLVDRIRQDLFRLYRLGILMTEGAFSVSVTMRLILDSTFRRLHHCSKHTTIVCSSQADNFQTKNRLITASKNYFRLFIKN